MKELDTLEIQYYNIVYAKPLLESFNSQVFLRLAAWEVQTQTGRHAVINWPLNEKSVI